MRKKIFTLLLTFLFLLSACAPPSPAGSGVLPAAGEIMEKMLAAAGTQAQNATGPEGSALAEELELYYGLPRRMWTDAAVQRGGGASAFELAVIQLSEDAGDTAVASALECLQNYITARQGDFTGYAPDQAALAENGIVLAHDRCLGLIIAENQEQIALAFENCFSGSATYYEHSGNTPAPTDKSVRYPYTDPKVDDMTIYDTSAILKAWQDGQRDGLSDKDRSILEAAEQVLADVLSDGASNNEDDMSDYEIERALYNWVCVHMEYDWDHQDPSVEMDPDSSNPYGGLINGKGICLGFATTFQLLMDMAGVECITVVGAAFRSTENHAWNMVRLDGTWTCVDATWDEASTDPVQWLYFNVSSDWLAKTDHQWEYNSVPEGYDLVAAADSVSQ